MAFVYSPSNMDTYNQCPRKFYGQSISEPREIKWKATKEKSRGSLVHTAIQKAVKHGLDTVTNWPEGLDHHYVQDKVNWARTMASAGYQIKIEDELCVNAAMQSAEWWDDDALLRARADITLVPLDNRPAWAIDIKTGKKWDDTDFQLRTVGLLTHLVYNTPEVHYAYWYVDTGEDHGDIMNFSNGLYMVQDIVDTMNNIKLAMLNNHWPTKKNRFCKWCGLHGKCGV